MKNKGQTKYDVIEKISEGGFSKVYLGRVQEGKQGNKKVIIKEIQRCSVKGNDIINNEILIHTVLQNDYEQEYFQQYGYSENDKKQIDKYKDYQFVRLIDYFFKKDKAYLVQQFYNRGTFQEYLNQQNKNNNNKTFTQVFCYIFSLIQAIKKLQEKKIIHCDIKPSNIFIKDSQNIVIGDFGLSKILGENQEVCQSHQIQGTEAYMAPEIIIQLNKYNKKKSQNKRQSLTLQKQQSSGVQLQKIPYSFACDIYSLGVLIYKSIFGINKYPYLYKLKMEIMEKEDYSLQDIDDQKIFQPLQQNYTQSNKTFPIFLNTIGKINQQKEDSYRCFMKQGSVDFDDQNNEILNEIKQLDREIKRDLVQFLEGLLDPNPETRFTMKQIKNHNIYFYLEKIYNEEIQKQLIINQNEQKQQNDQIQYSNISSETDIQFTLNESSEKSFSTNQNSYRDSDQ
ncbi:Protein kinase-like domain [Pseudocohnilembus persalinus]|uniref:non-specific serine/threonine protein kinase n=1 Tax=Pseudocohnilembus persalinus TaxID=266149 RepID=A0A0V0QED1_PSEPJ|nr:Protein kinase-like domain [Pseudocohnilembus persalinus]|eukprot:KRX00585.1 Protein kinase-like domain [Pseudocohnilembus persalinus]